MPALPRDTKTVPASSSDRRAAGSVGPSPVVVRTDPAVEEALERAAEHWRTFIHEMANLVEGSSRAVERASRSLSGDVDPLAARALSDVRAAGTALGHMAELIRAFTGPRGRVRREADAGPVFDRPRPLRECLAHAADVLRASAEERGVRLAVRAEPSIDAAPMLPLYPVISNGLRNAIEACAPGGGGLVEVVADLPPEPEGRVPVLRLDILDTGAGIDPRVASDLFKPGVTTKPGGSGIGLALAREVVTSLGGTIELANRRDGEREAARGAALRIRIPAHRPNASEGGGEEPCTR